MKIDQEVDKEASYIEDQKEYKKVKNLANI
jgi:hypothetical protein